MMPPTWTARCAAMLRLELRLLDAEADAVQLDGGFGMAALAAIMSVPEGPRRDLEIALWADRFRGRFLAMPIRPDASDAELLAWLALDRAIAKRLAVAS